VSSGPLSVWDLLYSQANRQQSLFNKCNAASRGFHKGRGQGEGVIQEQRQILEKGGPTALKTSAHLHCHGCSCLPVCSIACPPRPGGFELEVRLFGGPRLGLFKLALR